MKILHIVPGTRDISNGMVVAANLFAKEQADAEVVDLNVGLSKIRQPNVEEVWVHGMWLPKEWLVCKAVLKAGKRLVRMTHGALSPIYLKHQSSLKKRLVSPIEKRLFRKASRIVATCEAEKGWILQYLGRCCPPVEVTDVKQFFNLSCVDHAERIEGRPMHLLYLGRRHPLKGVACLQSALIRLQNEGVPFEFRVESLAFGEEKEKVWEWCDALILPTFSENFGLVIAEALEHGKRVITTDGAPAWGDGNTYGGRLIYIKGFLEGGLEDRIRLLKGAIEGLRYG